MKLHSENVAAFDCGGELQSIFAGCHRRCHQGRVKRVRVIDKRVLRDILQQARTVLNSYGILPDMRRLHRGGKLAAFAGKDASSRDLRAFIAAVEKPLHAKAYPEKWLAGRSGL